MGSMTKITILVCFRKQNKAEKVLERIMRNLPWKHVGSHAAWCPGRRTFHVLSFRLPCPENPSFYSGGCWEGDMKIIFLELQGRQVNVKVTLHDVCGVRLRRRTRGTETDGWWKIIFWSEELSTAHMKSYFTLWDLAAVWPKLSSLAIKKWIKISLFLQKNI